jgi:ribosomal protein L29
MDKVRQEETITKLNSELRNLRTQAYELREDNKRHMSEKEGIGKGGGMSYKQLEIKLSEANEENFILRKQKETVVAVNPKS